MQALTSPPVKRGSVARRTTSRRGERRAGGRPISRPQVAGPSSPTSAPLDRIAAAGHGSVESELASSGSDAVAGGRGGAASRLRRRGRRRGRPTSGPRSWWPRWPTAARTSATWTAGGRRCRTGSSSPAWSATSATPTASPATCAASRQHLDYLAELGVTYLHLMPLLRPRAGENDGGYAVQAYDEVEPALGTHGRPRGAAADAAARGA